MTVKEVRNLAALMFVGAGALAGKTVLAGGHNCYVCETNNYCRETTEGEQGQTTCVDPNQGWSTCSLSGDWCFWAPSN